MDRVVEQDGQSRNAWTMHHLWTCRRFYHKFSLCFIIRRGSRLREDRKKNEMPRAVIDLTSGIKDEREKVWRGLGYLRQI